MKMKYASVYNTWRDVRYLYFIPELDMKKIDGMENFTIQLYTQLVMDWSLLEGSPPTEISCAKPKLETVALTAIVDPQLELSQQVYYLQ